MNKLTSLQCKNIPEKPILEHLLFVEEKVGAWGTSMITDYDNLLPNSVQHGFPKGTPLKLVLAKMKSLIKKKLVDGCACGCRGDYEITEKGMQFLTK